jgi:hypothetical protein
MRTTDPTLSIKTKDGTIITTDEDFPTGTAYKQKFDMKETKREFIVAHTVYSIKELDDIKRKNPSLLDFLDKTNVFLELSITGSLTEVLLGPLLGVHPDNTNKKRLAFDLFKLLSVHNKWSPELHALRDEAQANFAFNGHVPKFQFRTRRIKREINDIQYSAKAVVFICAVEHRKFWEALLVQACADEWLNVLGRFYLLRKDDSSN